MKIDINEIKVSPSKFGFKLCQYGELDTKIEDWCDYWKLKKEKTNGFTNIEIPDHITDISEMFKEPDKYKYVDGFSPNLNKHLHIGHLSNLVISNSIQKLGIGDKFISILGDTLTGSIKKEEALDSFINYCKIFEYKVDKIYYASKMNLKNNILVDGDGEYIGSKCFEIDKAKIVGIKSNGSSSYFYQDVALAEELNDSTLYLTGNEQSDHFKLLKKIYPKIDHIPLGLILLDGKKMSSSKGNVIYLKDLIDELMSMFNQNIKLVYNVLAGYILKSNPNSNKSINIDIVNNPKISQGLYISYTMAHIKSCGVETKNIKNFNSKKLQFFEIKSKKTLCPNLLFTSLVEHCKLINNLYEKKYIKGNYENIELFSNLISDLLLGIKKLGMFDIDKV